MHHKFLNVNLLMQIMKGSEKYGQIQVLYQDKYLPVLLKSYSE